MRIGLSALFLVAIIVTLAPPDATAETISIPQAQLLPTGNSTVYGTNVSSLQVPPGTSGNFLAPVVLPQGAVIRSVTLEAHDNLGGEFGGYVQAQLSETRYETFLPLATLDTTIGAAPGDTRIEQVLSHEVDTSEFSYVFGVSINNLTGAAFGDVKFYKLIVEYDITQLEVVESGSGTTLLKVE